MLYEVITVTFTISNFVLAKNAEEETVETIPAEILLSNSELAINSQESMLFTIELTPHNTTDSVCLISDNPSAVWVSPGAIRRNNFV